MNTRWSNVKLRGQMMMKFYDFAIGKADETRNPMKPESNDSNLRFGRNSYFKISKNRNQIWAKMKNKTTFKAKLTSQITSKLQLLKGE